MAGLIVNLGTLMSLHGGGVAGAVLPPVSPPIPAGTIGPSEPTDQPDPPANDDRPGYGLEGGYGLNSEYGV